MTRHELVFDAVTPMLLKLGFKKRAGGIFTIDLSKDVIGVIGLNRATKHRPPGEVEINPVVGVRHQEVERLVAELRGDKFHAYQPSTIATPLGYVMPENRYRSWVFTVDRAETVATEMVATIAAHGLAFMHSMKGLTDLCRALDEGRVGFEHQLAYRRPVAWLLAGDPMRAREKLDQSVAALGDRSDLAAEELRRFATALWGRLSSA